ncbi:MAG: hypothetical protein WC394_02955, partial [Candidatus Omnitrophota bacterium]
EGSSFKEARFSPIDALSQQERIASADEVLQCNYATDFVGVLEGDLLSLRRAFLCTWSSSGSLSQAFSYGLILTSEMIEGLAVRARTDARARERLDGFVYHYLIARAIVDLSQNPTLVLIEDDDVDWMVEVYRRHGQDITQPQNILSLADLLMPLDNAQRAQSLANLIEVIERLQEEDSDWREGISQPRYAERIVVLRRALQDAADSQPQTSAA